MVSCYISSYSYFVPPSPKRLISYLDSNPIASLSFSYLSESAYRFYTDFNNTNSNNSSNNNSNNNNNNNDSDKNSNVVHGRVATGGVDGRVRILLTIVVPNYVLHHHLPLHLLITLLLLIHHSHHQHP